MLAVFVGESIVPNMPRGRATVSCAFIETTICIWIWNSFSALRTDRRVIFAIAAK